MYYYTVHVAPLLGGAIDSEFWTTSILQLAQVEQSIRQGLIAVSHAFGAAMEPDQLRRDEARNSYQSALRLTAERIANPEADAVALASCVLFLCLNCISRERREAVGLLRTGSAVMRKVLRGLHARSGQDEVVEIFLPIFERLLVLLRMFVSLSAFTLLLPVHCYLSTLLILQGEYSPHLREPAWLFSGDYQRRLQHMTSFREARSILHWLVFDTHHLLVDGKMQRYDNGYVSVSESQTQKCLHQQQKLLEAYASWQSGFEALCTRNSVALNQRQVAQLRLTHSISTMWTLTALSHDETIHDAYTDQYSQALDFAEEVLPETVLSDFRFEQGTIPPLYFVALRCREPVLRTRAITLLRKAPAREGLWDRDEALRTAKRVVELESPGSHIVADDIVLADARICEVRIRFTDASGTHVTFYSVIGQEAHLATWDECIPL